MRLTPVRIGFALAVIAAGWAFYSILHTSTPPPPPTSMTHRPLPGDREYVLAHQGSETAPTVIALHGAGESVDDFRALTGYRMEQLAQVHDFTLVYAVGVGTSFNDARTPLPYKARRTHIDDVSYLKQVVGDAQANPRSPTFGIGYSNGAHMLLRAVADAPGLFDGIAISGASLAVDAPAPTTPTSVVILSGTDDFLSPVNGGSPGGASLIIGPTLPVEDTARAFAEINEADEVQQTVKPGPIPIEITHWAGAAHEVRLYLADGAGHTFPVPNASRARLFGREPDLDFPYVSLQHLGAIS